MILPRVIRFFHANPQPTTHTERNPTLMEHITLYYRQGSSDKVYAASIQPKDDGHLVLFQYGRRGAALQSGQKTSRPVTYGEAKTIYDKLIREKLAKGYTAGENGSAYRQTDNAGQSTGILPQLLNPVEADDVPGLLRDPAYWMQEKFDGRRLLLRKEGDIIIGINRTGRVIALPGSLIESALSPQRLPHRWGVGGRGFARFRRVVHRRR